MTEHPYPGQKIGRWTVGGDYIITPRGERKYFCRCECGTERKALDKSLKDTLTHIDGTSLDMLKSRKLPTDSTTGYRGVYFIKGKYMAKIVFQQKAYYLWTYEDIKDAVKARREADIAVFQMAAVF